MLAPAVGRGVDVIESAENFMHSLTIFIFRMTTDPDKKNGTHSCDNFPTTEKWIVWEEPFQIQVKLIFNFLIYKEVFPRRPFISAERVINFKIICCIFVGIYEKLMFFIFIFSSRLAKLIEPICSWFAYEMSQKESPADASN